MPESASTVRFGAFEADLRTGELRKNGLKIKLEGQPLQILSLLLQRPGELVTREELKQALWPSDTFVDFDVSINAAVKRLRQALDDSAETPRFIETLPRRGYRFIYPVTGGGAPVAEATPRRWDGRRTAALLTTVALALTGLWEISVESRNRAISHINSLAVLPLENLTGDPEQEYFVDGIHDELITELAQISALKVISRTSVLRYKHEKRPLPDIARELGVNGVLEGAVRLGGDRVRMTVQLISAADDRHVWAQSYESDPRDLRKLPGQIAWTIARKLHVELTPQEQLLLANAKGVDPAVSKAYFKGAYYASKLEKDSSWKAIDYFHEALDLDPSYAPAWAAMGDCYERLAVQSHMETLPQANDALQKAVALDPMLREPHQALGRMKLAAWDWEGAAREFQRAREIDPNWEGPSLFLLISSHPDQAVVSAQRSAERDPLNYGTQLISGWTYFMAGRYDESIAQLQKTVKLDPRIHHAHYELAWGYAKKGMFKEAINECETALARQREKTETATVASCGWVYATAGRRREALDIAHMLEKKPGDEGLIPLAHTYDALGDRARALALLARAYDEHSSSLPRQWLTPMLSDDIKADPRFQELIRRTGNPWARFRPIGPSPTGISAKSERSQP